MSDIRPDVPYCAKASVARGTSSPARRAGMTHRGVARSGRATPYSRGRSLRGHQIPQARRSHRHRPRSGKRSASTQGTGLPATTLDAEDPSTAPPPNTKHKKEAKLNSSFALLRSVLSDADNIAEYVRTYHSGARFRDPKQVNAFLQAVGSRTDTLYCELMTKYKSEVVAVLGRLYSLYSVGKVPMLAPAHEFVIRCEQNGVRKSIWAADISPFEGAEASLLTPRELLQKLARVDAVGHLSRKVEMCSTVSDVVSCASKLLKMVTSPDEHGTKPFGFTQQYQLLSKLTSKARRVITPPKIPVSCAVTKTGECASHISPGSVDALDTGATPEGDTASFSLTEEEREMFKVFTTIISEALLTILTARPSAMDQQPLTKVLRFSKWCDENGLNSEDLRGVARQLEVDAEEGLVAQANQLEAVVSIKSLKSGDAEALKEIVDTMWKAGDCQCLHPHSADVLSAVATAAGTEGIPDELQQTIADRLVQTQRRMAEKGVQLPRRALRFVNGAHTKVKQAAIAQQLAEGHRAVGEEG